jgi:hypothetical protein
MRLCVTRSPWLWRMRSAVRDPVIVLPAIV